MIELDPLGIARFQLPRVCQVGMIGFVKLADPLALAVFAGNDNRERGHVSMAGQILMTSRAGRIVHIQ